MNISVETEFCLANMKEMHTSHSFTHSKEGFCHLHTPSLQMITVEVGLNETNSHHPRQQSSQAPTIT